MLKRLSQWIHNHRLEMAVTALSMLLLLVSILPYMLVTIDAGHVGVLWRRFFGGTELEKTWSEGTTLIFPWDKMEIYDLRLQRISETFNTLSSNGLEVFISVSFRFRPYQDHVSRLHKYVGPNFVDVVLIPEMGAHVRQVISTYSPEQLYSVKRDIIQQKILESIRNQLSVHAHGKENELNVVLQEYVFLDDVLVTSILLPSAVKESIEYKEQAKQLSYAYDHKIEIAKKEKLRKRIEAEGIRDFQNTITQGISEKYLRWEGIRATLKLSASNNSKVVIIGSGKDGLPIILGGDYTASTNAPVNDTEPERHAEPEIHSYGAEASPVRGLAEAYETDTNPLQNAEQTRHMPGSAPSTPANTAVQFEKLGEKTDQ